MEDAIKSIKETKNDSRVPSEPIKKHLINRCKNDDEFCEAVNKKDTDKLFNYVFGEVKKKLNNKNGWINDDEVYMIAESYFKKASKSKVDKEKPKQEMQQSKVIEFKTKTDHKPKNKPKKNKTEQIINNQMSIFDL